MEMTEEEIKKATDEYTKAYDSFVKNLKENPDEPVTNATLDKAIEFILTDVGGMAQMVQALSHNMNVLNSNFNQIVNAIQGTGPNVNKTKSGIILP